MTLSVPPRFVPTLTEVVAPQQHLPAEIDPAKSFALHPGADAFEAMVQRILQRLDLVLEMRLQNSLRQLILAHTQSLIPQLKVEIESVVRESVSQAVEQEAALPQSSMDARMSGKPFDPV